MHLVTVQNYETEKLMEYQKPRAESSNSSPIINTIVERSDDTVKQFKQDRLYSFNRSTYEWIGDIIGVVSLFAICFGTLFFSLIWG